MDDVLRNLLKSELSSFKSDLLQELKPSVAENDSPDRGLRIGEILQWLCDFDFATKGVKIHHVDVVYGLMFGGDDDKGEFDEIKRGFLKEFGVLTARKLCAYGLMTGKIDLEKGFTDEEMSEFVTRFSISMIFLLLHEDVSQVLQLKVSINRDNMLVARQVQPPK